MKKHKRINSKRPSLWIFCHAVAVIFYPNGRVEYFNSSYQAWERSYFYLELEPKQVIESLKIDHTFLGYL